MRISKEEFDALARQKEFVDGPYIEDEEYGEPYRPYRRLWGVLRDGKEVESYTDPDWNP